MKYAYKTQGVCSQQILFELEDGIVRNVQIIGGCNGNCQGVAALVEGMPATDVIRRVKGIRCGWKDTSCPDQLAHALEEALAKQ